MKISKFLYGFLILFILLAGTGVAKLTDTWEVSGMVNPDGTEVTLTGQDVEEIKGFNSIEEVIVAYNLEKDAFYQYMNFPNDLPTSTLVKDIKKLTGIDPEPIKDFINLQNSN